MIYARLRIVNEGFHDDVKLVAENLEAYAEYKEYLISNNFEIIDEFVDDDIGTIVVLPEDFKY